MADALSRCADLPLTFNGEIVGFECLKELYKDDEEFGDLKVKCRTN